MKRIHKIWSVSLIVCLMTLLMPTVAFADGQEITVSDYNELVNQINSADAGSIIKLTEEISGTSTITISKDIVLDLNGHNITIDLTSTSSAGISVTAGTLTVKDSSGGTPGTIGGNATYIVKLANTASLIVNGGQIRQDYSNFGGTLAAVRNEGTGSVTVEGGEIYAAGKATVYEIWNTKAGNVTLNGGSITTTSDVSGYGYGIQLRGGTFTMIKGELEASSSAVFASGTSEINISGGILKSEITTSIINAYGSNAKIIISGGTFKYDNAKSLIGANSSDNIGVEISGGDYSKALPMTYIVTDRTVVSLASSAETRYYVGTPAEIAEIMEKKAAAGDTIEVFQGGVNFSDVKAEVLVKNSGDGEVFVNQSKIEKNSAATVHKLTKTEEKEATCLQDGNIVYWYCADCKKYFSDEAGMAEISQDSLKIKGSHHLVKTEAKKATCTSDGNIEYWSCSVCGRLFSDAGGNTEITADKVVILKKEHSYGDWIITKVPTANEAGIREKVCSVCGDKVAEEIKADEAGRPGVIGPSGDVFIPNGPLQNAAGPETAVFSAPSVQETVSPQTGDGSNGIIWIGLMFAAATGLAGIFIYNRKKCSK